MTGRMGSRLGNGINPSKCHIMAVDSGPRTISHIRHFYELCGTILPSVDQLKYLGVILSHDHTWSPHIEKVATKANQILVFIRRNLKGSPEKLMKLAYIAIPSELPTAKDQHDILNAKFL